MNAGFGVGPASALGSFGPRFRRGSGFGVGPASAIGGFGPRFRCGSGFGGGTYAHAHAHAHTHTHARTHTRPYTDVRTYVRTYTRTGAVGRARGTGGNAWLSSGARAMKPALVVGAAPCQAGRVATRVCVYD